jgi:hypothetical protein
MGNYKFILTAITARISAGMQTPEIKFPKTAESQL